MLAEAHVARETDFGTNDLQFVGNTHLGNLLKPGDTAYGYDVASANFNDSNLVALKNRNQLPDFILVRKCYDHLPRKKRIWKLKEIEKEPADLKKNEVVRQQMDYDRFLEELEEDPELRANVNLYKDPNIEQAKVDEMATEEEEEEDFGVKLEELLEDLTLDDDVEEANDQEIESRHSSLKNE